jgi:hypothetical protein
VLRQIYGDQIKEDEIGGTCSMRGIDEMHTKLWSENLN